MSPLSGEALLELEHAGWASLCASQGAAFYGRLMLPHALMILVNGMILGRDTVAATLDDSPPWAGYRIADHRLVGLGPDGAALVYRAEAWRADDDAPFSALMSSTYRLVDGQPRLALYQQTTVTH